MLGHNSYFFYNSIRRYITVMGNLFSGFMVDRSKDGDTPRFQKVPISFQQKERFLAKLMSPESLNPTDNSNPNRKARVSTIVPAMALQLDTMSYNSQKKTSQLNRQIQVGNDGLPSQFLSNPVPYRFNFNLSIYTRNLSDQYALLEQILPFFQPSFTCNITELNNNDVIINRDVLINLDDLNFSNELTGNPDDKRYLQVDLAFSLDGYLYPPQTEGGVIKTVFIDFFATKQSITDADTQNLESVDWFIDSNNKPTENYDSKTNINDGDRNYDKN